MRGDLPSWLKTTHPMILRERREQDTNWTPYWMFRAVVCWAVFCWGLTGAVTALAFYLYWWFVPPGC